MPFRAQEVSMLQPDTSFPSQRFMPTCHTCSVCGRQQECDWQPTAKSIEGCCNMYVAAEQTDPMPGR